MLPPIVLLTDFGHQDPYVGQMKGVILRHAPGVPIVDLCHEILPMTVAQEERLRIILQRRLGTDIELNTQVDPAVIGGMRIRVRDLVIDSGKGLAQFGFIVEITEILGRLQTTDRKSVV